MVKREGNLRGLGEACGEHSLGEALGTQPQPCQGWTSSSVCRAPLYMGTPDGPGSGRPLGKPTDTYSEVGLVPFPG